MAASSSSLTFVTAESAPTAVFSTSDSGSLTAVLHRVHARISHACISRAPCFLSGHVEYSRSDHFHVLVRQP